MQLPHLHPYQGQHCAPPPPRPKLPAWTLGLYLPLLLVYLEVVLHLATGNAMTYFPIYLLFSLSAGSLLALLPILLPPLAGRILTVLLSFLLTLLFAAELIAKHTLQAYYPLSTLETAVGNRLSDYAGVILPATAAALPLLLVFFLPTLLLWPLFRWGLAQGQPPRRGAAIFAAAAVAFHLLGLAVVHAPWPGDLTPAKLYRSDTNFDDQVEQLGLVTMLRLDVKHMLFPAKAGLDSDFDGLDGLDSSGDGSGGDTSAVEEQPVIDTSPNVMDVDLDSLAANAPNEDVSWLANYFSSASPTRKNEYTGMFKGYNVIQLVIEGFSGYAIDPELTPTLYKLANEGFVFNNYYTALHYTSTSNGECQTLLGLYPKNGNPITMKRTGVLGTNAYFSLAQQLGREGYQVLGYHGNYDMYGRQASHTNLGYTWKQFGTGLDVDTTSSGEIAWPARDTQVIENSVDDYINSDQPFHVYYLTISGHMPYSNNRIVQPYLDQVRALPYSQTTQNYMATVMEVDRALELLLQKLEEAGKLDKTLIIATGDHIPYSNAGVLEELSGRTFGSSKDLEALNESAIDFDVYKNTLILWSASMEEPVQVDKPCCQVDILPTVSNLLGLEYDSRMLSGRDILSDSEGLVIFTSRSWRSDRGFYNRYTQTFTPAEGVTMTQEEQEQYVSTMKKLVEYKLACTPMIVENDFYNLLFPRE
ncbi:MAG: LTA synthase family protein [Flintibacter sp.]|uniref:LTA synthase family protein n=1 Tax=Flintibacter sp. TaxID=1918624 RepID=UPI002672196D|nr:LTA synthase family protein [Flintibacter sp.]MCI6150805.1 LTA synthase family protein [Flintibacter sp.]MDY5037104.1 LTA synthase family protein [Lawsonibacter sp.]